MGGIKGRLSYARCLIISSITLSLWLSGCTVVTAVSAIPGALYGIVADQFSSEEVSFPHSMRATLAATQHSLQTLHLDIDILEIQTDDGYGIAFNSNKLNGEITLHQHTEQLTTISISVKSRTREESIEHAIIQLIESTLNSQSNTASFDIAIYHDLRTEPSTQSKLRGWFRPGAMLNAQKSTTKNWLSVKMPSGDKAYMKGAIVSDNSTSNTPVPTNIH